MADKLVPVQVKVNQPGFPEAFCSYIKGDAERSDLFLVGDGNESSDVYVVTTDVVEALGRKDKSHVGIISSINGEVLVPFENKEVIKARDDVYVVVGAASSLEVKNAVSARENGDFSKVTELESAKDAITNQMKAASDKVEIVFANPFEEARTYKIKVNENGVHCVDPLSLPASYVGIDDENVYSHSNILNGSLKVVSYNANKKTDDVSPINIAVTNSDNEKDDNEIVVPNDTVPDKMEMPADEKPVVEEKEVNDKDNTTPTYDKLFSTLDKARGDDKKIVMSLNSNNPSDQLDEINSMLKQFVSNNPTDKLKKEIRELKAERDRYRQDLADSMKLNKELTTKCTDYQNELYAERAINKDLKAKVVQLKETAAEMKSRFAQQQIDLNETSAKLTQTVAIISSFVNDNYDVKDDTIVKAA